MRLPICSWNWGPGPGRRNGAWITRAVAACGAAVLFGAALLHGRALHAQVSPAAPLSAGADTTLQTPLAVAWKYNGTFSAGNAAEPVVVGNTVYFSTVKRVYAVDAQTGALKWRYPAEADMQAAVEVKPAVGNDVLYVGATDGLYALNLADGKLLWHYALKVPVNTAPLLIDNGVYFSGQNGRFYGVDAKTGESLGGVWSRPGNPGVEAGGDVRNAVAVAHGILYYVTSNQVFHAVDVASGIQKWGQRMDADVTNATPVVSGESLLLTAGTTLSSWRMGSGQTRWLIQLPAPAAVAPAVDSDGNSYVVTADLNIYAIDSRGRGFWHKAGHVDYEVFAPPVVANGLLLVGTAEGGVYAFDTATGALKWNYVIQPTSAYADQIPTRTNVYARPAISGDTLFVLSDDGALTAFRHGAPDTLPPTADRLEPQPGDYVSGRPPFHIGAHIDDPGSGLNLDTLKLKLDDINIPRRPTSAELGTDKTGFTYSPDDSDIDYSTVEAEAGKSTTLTDGHHNVTLSVQDWMGNTLTKTWAFTVDDTIPRAAHKPVYPGNPSGTSPRSPGTSGGYPGTSGGYPGGGGRGGRGGGGRGRGRGGQANPND